MRKHYVAVAILTSIMSIVLFSSCLLSKASASISVTNFGDAIDVSVDGQEKYIAKNDTKKWDFTWNDTRTPKEVTLSCTGCTAKIITLEHGDAITKKLQPLTQ